MALAASNTGVVGWSTGISGSAGAAGWERLGDMAKDGQRETSGQSGIGQRRKVLFHGVVTNVTLLYYLISYNRRLRGVMTIS